MRYNITMNTNPYFTHCISESIKVPNAPIKSKEARNMPAPPEIKSSICKALNFDDL